MERKIGEIFEYNGGWYQCLEGVTCSDCDFSIDGCSCDIKGEFACTRAGRSDGKSAVFKKLEKVGEPFISGGKLYQHYKVFDIDNIDFNKCTNANVHNYNKKTLTVEIKQNQEDMEERKLTYEELRHYYDTTVGLWAIDRSPQEVDLKWIVENAFQLDIDTKHSNSESIGKNLRPFSLEAAKSGKPVCTRDGRKARIICFDVKGTNYQILALIEECGKENTYCYDTYGKSTVHTDMDLMMLPEKHEGWTNVYKDGKNRFTRGFFQTKETAENATNPPGATRIATVQIVWEE